MSAITSVTQIPPAVQDPSVYQKPAESKPTEPKAQPTVLDTVQISTSAKAVLQEATETAAQTAQEALKGDRQALRLQEKRAAQESLINPNT
jgi:hypothetical protein